MKMYFCLFQLFCHKIVIKLINNNLYSVIEFFRYVCMRFSQEKLFSTVILVNGIVKIKQNNLPILLIIHNLQILLVF